MARWWCDGWLVKGSTTMKAGQTMKIERRNEHMKEGGLGFWGFFKMK